MYHIGFSLSITFSSPVERHYYTLRLFPQSAMREGSLVVNGGSVVPTGRDSFLNLYASGRIVAPHDCFLATLDCLLDGQERELVEGRSETSLSYFRHPTRLSACSAEMVELSHALKGNDPFEVSEASLEAIGEHMHYQKGSSDNQTSASQAFSARCGVCQDYAHIMLALLRERGIICRYVAGVSLGEGESHAWVEVLYKGRWRSYDPTRRQQAGPSHFPFAYARDALDSPLNSGVYYGQAHSVMDVRVSCREC